MLRAPCQRSSPILLGDPGLRRATECRSQHGHVPCDHRLRPKVKNRAVRSALRRLRQAHIGFFFIKVSNPPQGMPEVTLDDLRESLLVDLTFAPQRQAAYECAHQPREIYPHLLGRQGEGVEPPHRLRIGTQRIASLGGSDTNERHTQFVQKPCLFADRA